ncbi:MAG TPA: hypothetical protein VFH51_20665, partial [Myxococcota bacterium]|nr:hypothetical protein [Myxococcota bacterium]
MPASRATLAMVCSAPLMLLRSFEDSLKVGVAVGFGFGFFLAGLLVTAAVIFGAPGAGFFGAGAGGGAKVARRSTTNVVGTGAVVRASAWPKALSAAGVVRVGSVEAEALAAAAEVMMRVKFMG